MLLVQPSEQKTESVVTKSQAANQWTQWNAELRAIEDNGQWLELIERYESLRKVYSENEFGERWFAALARAYSFLGHVGRAEQLFEKWSQLPITQESRCVYWLAFSTTSRRRKNWKLALNSAETALGYAEKVSDPQLIADAQFAYACCISESGEKFRALDIFQKVRNSGRAVSQMRRDMAALNEASVLWDLGQISGYREALAFTPKSFQEGLLLPLAMVNDDQEYLKRKLRVGLDISTVNVTEKLYNIEFLVMWAKVSGVDVVQAAPWIIQFLDEPGIDGLNESVKALQAIARNQTYSFKHELPMSWREHLELSFFSFLSFLGHDNQRASTIYKNLVEPHLLTHNIRNPLFPKWQALIESETPWCARIAVSLGLNRDVVRQEKLVVKGAELVLIKGDGQVQKRLDLGKKLSSSHLLRALGLIGKNSFSKEDIHRKLDESEYDPFVHDSRIYKILKRTEKLLQDKFQITPWRMPGDGNIHLNFAIEVLDQ